MAEKKSGHRMSQGRGVDSNREGGIGELSGVAIMFYTLMGVRVAQVGTKCRCYDLCMSLYIHFTSKEQKQ